LYGKLLIIMNKKMIGRIKLYCLFAVLLLFFACKGENSQETEAEKIDTTLVLITKARQCARLYTAEYDIHKIITHDDELYLKGSVLQKDINVNLPLGKRKVAIPMDATVKAYVDFSNFSEENVRRYGNRIEIMLPDPEIVITQTKIRNEDIRMQVPLLRSDFSTEELSKYEEEGRKSIVQSLPKLGIVKMAEESSAKVLIPMIEKLGYKPECITISFSRDVNKSFYRATFNITDK